MTCVKNIENNNTTTGNLSNIYKHEKNIRIALNIYALKLKLLSFCPHVTP